MTLPNQKMTGGPIWTDEVIAVFVVLNGLMSGQTCVLVYSVPKHRNLGLEARVSFRSSRPSFLKLVSSRHLAAATFANLEDPFFVD